MYYISVQDSGNFMDIEYRTEDGKIINGANIGTQFSMVGQNYGITDLRFTVNVKNTGEIPLVAEIQSSSPTQLTNALYGMQEKVIDPSQTISWTTNWIATEQFEGTVPNFQVVVQAQDSLGRSVTKTGSKSIKISADPEIGIEVTITDSEDSNSDTDTGDDDNPVTCSNECSFSGSNCMGNDVYSCNIGNDGCRDLTLVSDCGNNGCYNGQCIVSGGCTEVTYSIAHNSLGGCIFDCRQSDEDCTGFYSTGAYSNQGPTYLTITKDKMISRGPAYNCKITKCE